MARRFCMLQVDVFTEHPLGGNPLAVFPDGAGLGDAEMQAIAREMNLSETTFVLPAEAPGADYRVRIFTPTRELPFAGHPTIGTAFAMLETGRIAPRGEVFVLRQQTLAGVQPIEVRSQAGRRSFVMTLPAPRFEPAPAVAELARALGIDEKDVDGEPATVRVGVGWHIVPLRGLDCVRSLAPDLGRIAEIERRTGHPVTVFCREAEDPGCSVRLRSFAPGAGIPEDPVCGSGNGCVGAYLARSSGARAPLEYRAEQGIEMGRPGRVWVRVEPDGEGWRVQVGGTAVTVVEGELRLPV
ncbi:MAG TPA: PhzF family phenazine biosynthesis protein [Myxococcota bacterium]|jgi:PhzF family phenazine biosynthesis protein